MLFSSFWKIQHADLDGQPDLWGIKALEREVLLVENIELRNRISRRTAHSGFCFLLFGEQAWKPKIPLLHTTVKHFPCGFTRTSRWFPVYPVVPFWLQWPHPQALQEGKAPNGTALQKVISLVRCCRTDSLNYLYNDTCSNQLPPRFLQFYDNTKWSLVAKLFLHTLLRFKRMWFLILWNPS